MDSEKIKNPRGNQNSTLFCTIAYQAESGRHRRPIANGLLLVVLKTPTDGVRFFLDPLWRETVNSEDASYLQDVFEDLPRRARNPGDDVFAQLCELSAGPLATVEVGDASLKDSFIKELTGKFIQI